LIGQFLCRGFLGAPIFQAHLNLAQAENLAALERRFTGYLIAVDKSAVGGIKIVNNDLAAAKQYFAVVTGNGGFRNRKRVVIDATDGGFVHRQFVSFARQSFAENYQSCHIDDLDYVRPAKQVKRFSPYKPISL
jgi:hypothetical protein